MTTQPPNTQEVPRAADLNNDGHVTCLLEVTFAWYENDGEGSFSGPNNLNDASEYWAGARASFTSDFNGDVFSMH